MGTIAKIVEMIIERGFFLTYRYDGKMHTFRIAKNCGDEPFSMQWSILEIDIKQARCDELFLQEANHRLASFEKEYAPYRMINEALNK